MSEEKQGQKNGKFWMILSILLFLALGASGLINLLLGGALVAITVKDQMEGEPVFPVKILEGKGNARILLLQVSGIIAEEKLLGKTAGETPEQIRAKLRQAAGDEAIKAVVLKINSPGGAVTASDSIYRYLREFRRESGKPVVAYLDAVAASGGYYIAVACDEIVAHPTTITGSIGVILQYFRVTGLLKDRLGIEPIVIKSGNYKDIASAFRGPNLGDEQILRNMVEEVYERFLAVVEEGRPGLILKDHFYLFSVPVLHRQELVGNVLSDELRQEFAGTQNPLSTQASVSEIEPGKWRIEDRENQYSLEIRGDSIDIYGKATLRRIADGRIYTAKQSLELGLLDREGYFTDALDRAKILGHIGEEYQLVAYERPRSMFEKILDPALETPSRELVEYFLQQIQTPGFYYLWQ